MANFVTCNACNNLTKGTNKFCTSCGQQMIQTRTGGGVETRTRSFQSSTPDAKDFRHLDDGIQCLSCNTKYSLGKLFCMDCSVMFSNMTLKCEKCGRDGQYRLNLCSNCWNSEGHNPYSRA
jgi:predicted amidophosphoribosyltransferase